MKWAASNKTYQHTFYALMVGLATLLFPFTPTQATSKALLIGIANYQSQDIPNLPGIEQDLYRMQTLAQSLGIDKNHITTLTNQQATHKNITQQLDSLITESQQLDQILVYFSGHGTNTKDLNNDEADRFDEVLLPYDASYHVQEKKLKNVIIDDQLNHLLSQIPAEKLWVIIDACHSGSATRHSSFFSNKNYTSKYVNWNVRPSGNQLAYNNLSTDNVSTDNVSTDNVSTDNVSTDNVSTDNVSTNNAPTRSAPSSTLITRNIKIETATEKSPYVVLTSAKDHEESLSNAEGSVFTRSLYESIQLSHWRPNRSFTWQQAHANAANKIEQQFKQQPTLIFRPVLQGPATFLTQPKTITAAIELPGSAWQITQALAKELPTQLPTTEQFSLVIGIDHSDSISLLNTPQKTPTTINPFSLGLDSSWIAEQHGLPFKILVLASPSQQTFNTLLDAKPLQKQLHKELSALRNKLTAQLIHLSIYTLEEQMSSNF